MQIKLQKYLRDSLGLSRRKADDLIDKGQVTVNAKKAELGQSIDTSTDTVLYKKKPIPDKTTTKKLQYLLFNKPTGFITSRFDPHDANTIYTILPKEFETLFPVGRLDRDTEGLLILTNDGELAYKLTHPKFLVDKEYYVEIDGALKPTEKTKIEKGLKTELITSAPCKITVVKALKSSTKLNIIIHEGQKREIRKIFKTFGYHVTSLKRIRVSTLLLGELAIKKWRALTPVEVKSLKSQSN